MDVNNKDNLNDITNNNIQTLILQAKEFEKQEKFEEAEEYYRKAVNIDVNNKEPWIELALYLRREGELTKWTVCCEKIREIHPNETSFLLDLASIYKIYSKNDKAEDCYKQLIRVNPKDKDAIELLFGLCRKEYCFLEKDALRKILILFPGNEYLEERLRKLLEYD